MKNNVQFNILEDLSARWEFTSLELSLSSPKEIRFLNKIHGPLLAYDGVRMKAEAFNFFFFQITNFFLLAIRHMYIRASRCCYNFSFLSSLLLLSSYELEKFSFTHHTSQARAASLFSAAHRKVCIWDRS